MRALLLLALLPYPDARLAVASQLRVLEAPATACPRISPAFLAEAAETLDDESRVDQDAHDRSGAFKVGSHDDLVTAVGLATQEDHHGDVGSFLEMLRLDRGRPGAAERRLNYV